MKIFPHLFAKLFSQPLMLNEPVRFALESNLLRHMGMVQTRQESEAPKAAGPSTGNSRIDSIYTVCDSVAVVSLNGIVDKHISQMDMLCYGGADLADFDSALILAGEDPKVQRVVLAINSPGGSVTGVPETAARVAALAQEKEVLAFVDCMACSAAYYIASQASVVSVAPSATVGSIGVYLSIVDATRAAEMEGYRVELITAGKFKAMGSPFKPLSDEEREIFQTRVTNLHNGFRDAVRSGRAGASLSILNSTMEGQTFDGSQAVTNGLADELTSLNLDEYVSELLSLPPTAAKTSSSLPMQSKSPAPASSMKSEPPKTQSSPPDPKQTPRERLAASIDESMRLRAPAVSAPNEKTEQPAHQPSARAIGSELRQKHAANVNAQLERDKNRGRK